MNFDHIDDERQYTRAEVAAMLGVKPRTVKKWQNDGLRNRQGGVFSLEILCIGGKRLILGAHLKKFLALCQIEQEN